MFFNKTPWARGPSRAQPTVYAFGVCETGKVRLAFL